MVLVLFNFCMVLRSESIEPFLESHGLITLFNVLALFYPALSLLCSLRCWSLYWPSIIFVCVHASFLLFFIMPGEGCGL